MRNFLNFISRIFWCEIFYKRKISIRERQKSSFHPFFFSRLITPQREHASLIISVKQYVFHYWIGIGWDIVFRVTHFPAVDLGTRRNALRDWRERSCVLSCERRLYRYYIDLPVSGLYSAACFSAVPSGPSPRDHRRSRFSSLPTRIRGFSSRFQNHQQLTIPRVSPLANVDERRVRPFSGITVLKWAPWDARVISPRCIINGPSRIFIISYVGSIVTWTTHKRSKPFSML